MKNIVALISTLAFAFLCILNCSLNANGPVHGNLVTVTSFAGEVNPYNDVEELKEAKGCQTNVLLLVNIGDAGAGQIAKENGISRIASIDYSSISVLTIIFNRFCTIVRGE